MRNKLRLKKFNIECIYNVQNIYIWLGKRANSTGTRHKKDENDIMCVDE